MNWSLNTLPYFVISSWWGPWYGRRDFEKDICVPLWASSGDDILNRNRHNVRNVTCKYNIYVTSQVSDDAYQSSSHQKSSSGTQIHCTSVNRRLQNVE